MVTDAGGTTSDAGSAGSAGSPETPGASGSGSGSHTPPNTDGSGGNGGDSWQTTIVPGCIPDETGANTPALAFAQTYDAGIARADDTGYFQLVAARRDDNAIGSAVGKNTSWSRWGCMGYVPGAQRMISSNIAGGRLERLFAVTSKGEVFWKQEFLLSWGVGWGAYLPFNLPTASSFISDVATATSSTGIDYVYAVDRSKIFFRNKFDSDPDGPYGNWAPVGVSPGPGGAVVTAGALPDGRQIVFGLDADGSPVEARQVDPAVGSAFDAWQPSGIGAPTGLTDIECGMTSDGRLQLFAARHGANIWTSTANVTGSFSTWTQWAGPAFTDDAVTIATSRQAMHGPAAMLVVTTLGGHVFVSAGTNDTWAAWLKVL